MPISWTYTAPKVNALALMHAAKEAAELAGAEVLLKAAEPLVPVDKGVMLASGKVEHGEAGAEVSFTREGADGYNVAARQHEDLTLHHDHGEAHFLSKPMSVEQAAILAAQAEVLRAAFGG